MSDQPTPLVDAVVFIQPDLNLQVVDADFARRLERCARMMAQDLIDLIEDKGEHFYLDPDSEGIEIIRRSQANIAAWRELNR